MMENNLAVILSSGSGRITGTHLPFVIKQSGKEIKLISHFAKGNQQWKELEECNEALVIFQGAHAYISPGYYEHKTNVPTWNYTAVHAYGAPALIKDDEGLISMLKMMFDSFEDKYHQQWEGLPPGYKDKLLKEIVGVEISITRLEGKFKLSQNKTRNEQENIIIDFEKKDGMHKVVAKLMKENLRKAGKLE